MRIRAGPCPAHCKLSFLTVAAQSGGSDQSGRTVGLGRPSHARSGWGACPSLYKFSFLTVAAQSGGSGQSGRLGRTPHGRLQLFEFTKTNDSPLFCSCSHTYAIYITHVAQNTATLPAMKSSLSRIIFFATKRTTPISRESSPQG